jgi:hypothetical protein
MRRASSGTLCSSLKHGAITERSMESGGTRAKE